MRDVNRNIFREYDIRGKAETELTSPVVEDLGQALGTWLIRRNISKLAVGADNRVSSPRLRKAVIEGLMRAGCHIIDVGTVITPMLYSTHQLLQVDAGVMVTGSHNPPDENGFKIAVGSGTIYGETIQELRVLMEEGDFVTGSGSVTEGDIRTPYLRMLQEKIVLSGRPLKVAVDCGNGTGSFFAENAFRQWGCDVLPLFCESDPTFPNHHPDPVKSENLADLKRAVLENKCDLGIGFDGDADRLGVVDDQGGVVWGDTLMALYWREILQNYPGAPVIVEVKCSQALVDEAIRMGGKPMFYRTGHSLIKAKMKELNAPFTGEMSGHMFFADEYGGFDDAFYAAGRLLRILSNAKEPLSALLEPIPKYYSTAETRVTCEDAKKFAVVDNVKNHLEGTYEVIDVDGARVLFPDGWGLIRASNTQPALVARCEATSPEALQRICGIIHDTLVTQGGIGSFNWAY